MKATRTFFPTQHITAFGAHLAAVTTNTGQAMIVTGRGIRSLKRQCSKQLRSLARKQSRCQKHSRRWKNTVCRRTERRVRDLRHKATRQVIDFCVKNRVGTLFIGSERGISSRCPACGHRHKPKGRRWACRACRFTGHRDLVGSINMHTRAFGTHPKCPRSFTYLRPGRTRSRSSRAGTPQCCLGESAGQPRIADTAFLEAGYTVDVAQKLIR